MFASQVQALCFVAARIFVTLYLVPRKGVPVARKSWWWMMLLSWGLPLVVVVVLLRFGTRRTATLPLPFSWWLQYGLLQTYIELAMHATKTVLAVWCLFYCSYHRANLVASIKRAQYQALRESQTNATNSQNTSGSTNLSPPGRRRNSLSDIHDLLTTIRTIGVVDEEEAKTLALYHVPERTLRTEVLAVVFIINGLYHIVLLIDVLSGGCGSVDQIGMREHSIQPEISTCSVFVLRIILLGSATQGGQGLFTLFLLLSGQPWCTCPPCLPRGHRKQILKRVSYIWG